MLIFYKNTSPGTIFSLQFQYAIVKARQCFNRCVCNRVRSTWFLVNNKVFNQAGEEL